MNILYKKVAQLMIVLACISAAGCKKFVEVDLPIDSVPTEVAFDSEIKIASAVRALYLNLVRTTNFGLGGAMSVGPGVSSDEMFSNNPTATYNEFSINAVSPQNTALSYYWNALYNTIYLSNLAIINVPKSDAIGDKAKTQYVAEARFVRAISYFYLVNLFGDVPLALTDDYRVNARLPRAASAAVYQVVVDDLKFAAENLGVAYPGATTALPRIRANRFAAKALLSRVYLYLGDWANAEAQATEVVEAKDAAGATFYTLENNLNNAFLLSSKEVILHLLQGGTLLYTWEAYAFVPASATTVPTYQFTEAFLDQFPKVAPLDQRRTSWIYTSTITAAGQTKTYYSPYKYKLRAGTGTAKTEALAFMRLSEVLLTRAEARAELNKTGLAIADLDAVRRRAGLTLATPAATPQTQLLGLIARERSLELFAEMGHRWFDLKRRGQADLVLKDKPNWRPEAKLLPIPVSELKTNLSLHQNPGYTDR